MPKPWFPTGLQTLALPERFMGDVARLALMGPQRWRAGLDPSLLERAEAGIQRVVAMKDERPPQPIGSPADIPVWANGEGEYCEGGYALLDDIALIDVAGVLTPRGYYDWYDDEWFGGYRGIVSAARAAAADGRVAGILYVHDSPGGLTASMIEASRALRSVRDEGGKPTAAFARMSCSAAQCLSAQAGAIWAEPDASVGSIGIRMGYFDMSGWLERIGDTRHEWTSGRLKDMGTPFRAPTEEESGLFQAEVDHLATRFYREFAAGRRIDAEAIAAHHGWEARVFTVGAAETGHADLDPQAADVGIVDDQLTYQQAFEALRLLARPAASGGSFDAQTGGVGRAPGGGAQPGTASVPTSGPDQESDMDLKAKIAALRAKAATGDKSAIAELEAASAELTALLASAEGGEEDGTAEGDDEEDTTAEDEGDKDAKAEGDDEEDTTAEGEGEEEPKAQTGAEAGCLIARLAKDQGKPSFGATLAAQVGAGSLTFAQAKGLLSEAAREASPILSALVGGRAGVKPTAPAADKADDKDGGASALAAAHKRLGRRR